jgi:hypothetical protein
MSEDGYGLDKAARLAAQEAEEVEPPMRLEPEFPFEVVAFDLEFWEGEDLNATRKTQNT